MQLLRHDVDAVEGKEMSDSGQEGGDGYGKVKKSMQTGGASGWAKHCGDTKDHQLSNRLERRSAKQALKSGAGGGGNKIKGKRVKPPTRKHLMDRFNHWSGQAAQRKREIDQHKKEKRSPCACYMYCGDRWLDKYYAENLAKVLKEFEKYGYKKP